MAVILRVPPYFNLCSTVFILGIIINLNNIHKVHVERRCYNTNKGIIILSHQPARTLVLFYDTLHIIRTYSTYAISHLIFKY